MKRLRGFALAVVGAAVLASAGAAAGPTLTGSVGPGFTISLVDASGQKVTNLDAGGYTIVVHDLADIHDFHLSGPGLNRVLTGVDFTGAKSVGLTLKKGVYRYVCDPHSDSMHGSFRVV